MINPTGWPHICVFICAAGTATCPTPKLPAFLFLEKSSGSDRYLTGECAHVVRDGKIDLVRSALWRAPPGINGSVTPSIMFVLFSPGDVLGHQKWESISYKDQNSILPSGSGQSQVKRLPSLMKLPFIDFRWFCLLLLQTIQIANGYLKVLEFWFGYPFPFMRTELMTAWTFIYDSQHTCKRLHFLQVYGLWTLFPSVIMWLVWWNMIQMF